MDWLAELPVGTGPDSVPLRISLSPRPRDGPVPPREVSRKRGWFGALSRNQLENPSTALLRVPMGEFTLSHI